MTNCETDYGEQFTACQTNNGWECCFIGETIANSQDNLQRIDCFDTYGEQFEDCERDWGWDCCMKDDVLTANLANSASTPIEYNEEPIDCFQKYGEKFQDCQTAMGWDCCVVGDELDESDLQLSFQTTTNTCSQELGPEFTDCGHGYGLDCCYIDDGEFKHDHNHASKSTNLTDSGSLKHFDAFYANQERKSCVEQFGANFTDCGNTHGLDCCYIDDGVLFYDHSMHGGGHSNGDAASVLRGLVVTAMIAFVVISRVQRGTSGRSRSRGSAGVGKPRKVYDDEDEDSNNGDEVELKPLI